MAQSGPGTCSGVTFTPNPPTAGGFVVTISDPQVGAWLANPDNNIFFRLRLNQTGERWGNIRTMSKNGNTVSINVTEADMGFTSEGSPFQFMLVRQVGTNPPPDNSSGDMCMFQATMAAPQANDPNSASCSTSFVSIPNSQVSFPTVLNFDEGSMINFDVGRYNVKINGQIICPMFVGVGVDCSRPTNYTFLRPNNIITLVGENGRTYCSFQVTVPEDAPGPVEVVLGEADAIINTVPFRVCEQIDPASPMRGRCDSCIGDQNDGTPDGLWTAIGCVKTDPSSIVSRIMQIGMSLAGGVALLMILASGFLFSTSQGDPKRTNEAKELLTSAVIGLLFIIFSVTILQFIGVSILRIPDFGI